MLVASVGEEWVVLVMTNTVIHLLPPPCDVWERQGTSVCVCVCVCVEGRMG